MSFEASAGYSHDKACDLFGRAESDPCNELFDQYLDFDTIDGQPASHMSTHQGSMHMVSPIKGSRAAGTLSSLSPGKSRHINLQQPSQEDDEWPLTTKPISQPQQTYTDPRHTLSYNEETGRAAISDSDLLSLDGIDLKVSPRPPHSSTIPSSTIPSSPTPEGPTSHKKNRFFDSITKTVRKAIKGSASESNLRSPIRRKASSKMMRASQYSNAHPEWSQRMNLDASKFNDQKFNFDFPHQNGPLSPPPSARVSDASDCSNQMLAMHEQQNNQHGFQYEPPMPPFAQRSGDYHTPLSTPNLSHDNDSRRASVHHQPSMDQLVYPTTPHTGATASSPWAHTPNTSEFDGFRGSQHHPFVSDAESSPVWWSTSSSAPMAQPSPSIFHNPHQSQKTLAMQLQSELAYNASELACSPSSMSQGLMIQMPHSPIQPSYVVDSLVPGQGYFNGPHASDPTQFSTPDLTRQYSEPRLRKQSIISPTGSPSPKSAAATSFQVQKRRSASRTKTSDIAPRTPVSGNGMRGSVDFVNFTPSDSMKILTGVAPSGSSKTKARREKEAMEKRRRLSLAAVRAVRAAGGDVESLVEEGLFVGVGV